MTPSSEPLNALEHYSLGYQVGEQARDEVYGHPDLCQQSLSAPLTAEEKGAVLKRAMLQPTFCPSQKTLESGSSDMDTTPRASPAPLNTPGLVRPCLNSRGKLSSRERAWKSFGKISQNPFLDGNNANARARFLRIYRFWPGRKPGEQVKHSARATSNL